MQSTITVRDRLLSDAQLLMQYGRFSSAHALAILALEEQGKLILATWAKKLALPKTKQAAHIQKQLAVYSVIAGYDFGRDFAVLPKKLASEIGLPADFQNNVEKRLLANLRKPHIVATGALDKLKQLSFYSDDLFAEHGFYAHDIDQANMDELLASMELAQNGFVDMTAMVVGRGVYEAIIAKPWFAKPKPRA